jgi:hypothetical protein
MPQRNIIMLLAKPLDTVRDPCFNSHMTNNTNPTRHPLTLTIEEMEYTYEVLCAVKSAAAREGRPYPKHSARVRTELEEAISRARTAERDTSDIAELRRALGIQRKASLK